MYIYGNKEPFLHFRIFTGDVLAKMIVVMSRTAPFKASLRVSVQGEEGLGERSFRTRSFPYPTPAPDSLLAGYVKIKRIQSKTFTPFHTKAMWTFN